jgi:hypothetical protein
MKNAHLLLFPVLTLFAIVAAAQTATEAPNPTSTQDVAAPPPSQSSSTPRLELFPTPEVPPEEAPKNPASTQDLAMPGQSASASRAELFPIMEVPPDEVPLSTVSTDLSATPPSESPSASHVDLFPTMEVPLDEVPKSTEPAPDLDATPLSESPSASHVDFFPTMEVPLDEVPKSTEPAPDLDATSPSEPSAPRGELFPMPEVPADAPLTPAEIELQAQIQNAISKDPTLTSDSVNVSLFPGGIELSGTVASVRARLAASRLAKSYAANKKVVDKITIAVRRETPGEASPAKAETPGTDHQHP